MTTPSQEQAIERLSKALDEVPSLQSMSYRSSEFSKWQRSTKITIARIFGSRSEAAEEFDAIRYPVATPATSPSLISRNEGVAQREYEYNLGKTAGLLQSMIDEIGEYGLPNPQPASPTETVPVRSPTITQKVFVVHGRNQKARDAMFTFLRAIGLHPLEWNEAVQATGKPMPYIGEILDAAFAQAGAVVVLMTPDDEARLREQFRSPSDPPHETELTGQARANVLFEAGMAMGRNADRTILVELGSLRPFSDVAGLHVIRMDNRSQRRQELAQRLESAGCPVNLDGVDWHTAGDFDTALLET